MRKRSLFCVGVLALLGTVRASDTSAAADEPRAIEIPTGQTITPEAAQGAVFQDLDPKLAAAPDMRPGQAVALSVAPDGRTLAILTSGYNRFFSEAVNKADPKAATDPTRQPEFISEYLFLFDISTPKPKPLQVIEIPNTFQGLLWSTDSNRVFASGGKDDTVMEFVRSGTSADSGGGANAFARGRTFNLGHKSCVGIDNTNPEYPFLGRCEPITGGLALSPDGTQLLVTNLENDSVSLLDLAGGKVIAEQDLRPGAVDPRHRGQPGGSYPRSVVWTSATRAYVASERDREIIALDISGSSIRVTHRMPVRGQPVALVTNRAGSRLYAALSTTSGVAIFETARNTLLESVDVTAPPSIYPNTRKLGGASSNALALTPDQQTLLVSNGGENAVAVVRLSDRASGQTHRHGDVDNDGDDDDKPSSDRPSTVVGLMPTAWYPAGVVTSKDGAIWYIINGKSETGPTEVPCQKPQGSTEPCPSVGAVRASKLRPQNRFLMQLEKAGLLSLPAPNASELARLTQQVARNDHFDKPALSAADRRLFAFLHQHIKHVIYIIKENRSYDEVLGDLGVGNGDPHLTLFPQSISPNHHAIARNFVTLDNFLVSGEVSWSGWDWSVSAQTNDFREHQEPLTMANRGMGGEATGFNRNISLGLPTSARRHAELSVYPADPDIIPGEHDVAAPDGPGGEEATAFLWGTALRAGRTVRNWGFWGENRAYNAAASTLVRDPYAQKQQVFFSTKSALTPYSDPYFLDFAPNFPDYWRVKEWQREFNAYSARKPAPNLMLIRLGNDHFGAFAQSIDGVNTPETQMADNDYALGLILETVAHSPFAKDTLIISIEDDACDGPDHVDTHRSVALFAGAYVRQHSVVSKRYTTVSVVKTIEEILGLGPIALNDALAAPMSELFDLNSVAWAYQPIVPDVLRSSQLPLPPTDHPVAATPAHSAAYWSKAMANQDFSGPDRIDPASFNHALWRGLKGNTPYPTPPQQK